MECARTVFFHLWFFSVHILSCAPWVDVPSLVRSPLKIALPILALGYFLLLNFKGSLYISDIRPLSVFCKYFFSEMLLISTLGVPLFYPQSLHTKLNVSNSYISPHHGHSASACHPSKPKPFLNVSHSLPSELHALGHHCPSLAVSCFYWFQVNGQVDIVLTWLSEMQSSVCACVCLAWRRHTRQEEGIHGVCGVSSLCEANACLSSFPWSPVIKPPLRHFKRPAYASSSYAPSVPKKTDDHPARYKMLDQRIKMKKIQNISHHWNKK